MKLQKIIFCLITLFSIVAFPAPLQTTYQARIIKPDGEPLEVNSVHFKFTVLGPSTNCVLYSETFTGISLLNTRGLVSLSLGTGIADFNASGTATFSDVFNNTSPSLTCQNLTVFNPQAHDDRKIVMQFNDGTGWQTLPALSINAVPYAIFSYDTQRLGGVSSSAYVRHSTIPSCTGVQTLTYNNGSFNCVATGSLISSSDVATALGYVPVDQSIVQTSFTTMATSFATSYTVLVSTLGGLSSSLSAINSSQWTTQGADVFYESGRVGIGTSSPTNTLEVNGHISFSSNAQYLKMKTVSNAVTRIFGINGVDDLYIGGIDTAISSTLFVNNGSEKVRIDSSGNLGIGTANPTALLHLAAGSTTSAPLKLTQGSLLSSPQSGTIEYDGTYFYLTDNTNRKIISTGSVAGSIDDASNINSTNNITMSPTGSVVVSSTTASTDSQTGALIVRGGLGIAGHIFSSGTIITSSNIQGASITATSGISTNVIQGNSNLSLNPNAGNVGVGTVSPLTKLAVNGNTVLGGVTAATGAASVDTTVLGDLYFGASGSWKVSSAGTANLGYLAVNAIAGAGAQIDTITASSATIGLRIKASASQAVDLLQVENNSAATIAAITSTGGGYFSGNLGIGVTAPISKLHVSGGTIRSDLGTSGTSLILSGTGSNMQFNHDGAGFVKIFNSAANSGGAGFKFQNFDNTSSLLTIQNDGAIGIGASAPTQKVHVDSGSTNGAYMQFTNSDSGATIDDGFHVGIGTGEDATLLNREFTPMRFYTNNTERMVISASGSVGIGVSATAAKFEVLTAQSEAPSTVYGSVAGSLFKISGRELAIGTVDSPPYATYFQSRRTDNAGNDISINPGGGLVGIGTVSPIAGLEVHDGPVMAGGENRTLRLEAIHPAVQFKGIGFATNSAWIDYDDTISANGLNFRIAGSDNDIGTATKVMTIAGSGNVGIGIADPTTKLQVNGVIAPALNNSYALGSTAFRFTEVFATNGVINTSDRREKKEILDSNLGLNFINQLRPVSYRWNTNVDGDIHYGLIAQETEQAVTTSRGDQQTTSIVLHDKNLDRYGVRYSELIAPLIKAVQELYNRYLQSEALTADKIEKLTLENQALKAYICSKDPNAVLCKN